MPYQAKQSSRYSQKVSRFIATTNKHPMCYITSPKQGTHTGLVRFSSEATAIVFRPAIVFRLTTTYSGVWAPLRYHKNQLPLHTAMFSNQG